VAERRRVLVAGGSGGIGGATCVALAEADHQPIIGFAANEAAAAALARRCDGIALPLDLMDERAIDAAVECIAAEDTASPLHGVVLAASAPPVIEPFTRIAEAEMARQWQVSVAGPRRLLAGLVKRCFAPRKAGAVVGVLSQAVAAVPDDLAGRNVRPARARSMGAYLIAKYGQAGLLAVLAAEYTWLRVRAVSPGYTRTRMLEVFDPRFLELQAKTHPIRAPEEVAQEIVEEIIGS
jgi:NAD(P)-dependent dehydrogenase (short-subunit alcohol dehydrogenase family)